MIKVGERHSIRDKLISTLVFQKSQGGAKNVILNLGSSKYLKLSLKDVGLYASLRIEHVAPLIATKVRSMTILSKMNSSQKKHLTNFCEKLYRNQMGNDSSLSNSRSKRFSRRILKLSYSQSTTAK